MDLVHDSLKTDQDFLLKVVELNPRCLIHVPTDAMRRFPAVIDRGLLSLQKCNDSDISFHFTLLLAQLIPTELWDDRAFLLRWFDNGLPFHNAYPFREEWYGDGEIFIRVAKHCRASFRRLSFQHASLSLLNNKEFMMRAVELQPSLIEYITTSPALRYDFELRLNIFSFSCNHDRAVQEVEIWAEEEHAYFRAFQSEVNSQLFANEVFTSLVLPAISLDSCCALALLNQGTSTSLGYKKLIAQFLNVPTGKQLRMLREASSALDVVLRYDEDGYEVEGDY